MKKIIDSLFIGAMALFTLGACSDVPMPYEIGGGDSDNDDDSTVLFSASFAGGQDDFTIDNKEMPDELTAIWTTGSSYIKASGSKYMSDDQTSPTKFDAESWLISPSIDLASASHATLTFTHAARYFYSNYTGMTVLVSEAGTDVWTQLTIPNYPDGSDWTFVSSGDISLDDYVGKQIQIAFRYISTTSTSPTWELQTVLIEDREAESSNTPSEGTGDGTKENPYDIDAAKSVQDGEAHWVKGYIVGDVSGQVLSTGAEFASPFSSQTNILIANSSSETSTDNCMPVQLPSGEIRDAVNLSANESNLGKEILIYGTLEAYFGTAGIKNVTAVSFDGGTTIIGTDPDAEEEEKDPDNPLGLDASNPVSSFSVDFEELTATTYGYCPEGWINAAMTGTRTWTGYVYSSDNSKYMQATAYGTSNTDESNEIWLVSPAITIDDTNKYVTFDCAVSYYKAGTTLKVYFLQLVDGKMESTEISVANIPGDGATNYEWTTDLCADLSSYTGKTGFVGFQYCGNKDSATGTYCLDNIKTASQAPSGGNEETTTETVTVTTDQAYEESFSSDSGKFYISDKELSGLSYVWNYNSYGYMKATAYVSSTNYATESWLISPIVDLSSVSGATLTFDHVYRYGNASTITSDLTLQVSEYGTDTWTTVTIPNYSTGSDWTFVSSGDIDLSSYAGKKIQFAFKYTSTTSAAATWEIKNVKVAATSGSSSGGETETTPLNENLLSNSGFETWTDGSLDSWNVNSAGNATISQSSDARTGSSSVYVTNASSNKRLGSKEYTLSAGSYTFSIYAKNATTTATGKIRMGYVPVVDGTVQSSNYNYLIEATEVTSDWAQYTVTFDLSEATTVSVVVMSSKSTGDVLIDDSSLTRTK